MGLGNQPEEVIADTMTIHLVPSYVIFGPDYFAAFYAAEARAAKIIKSINDRFSIQDMRVGVPIPDPAFRVGDRFYAIIHNIALIEAALEQIGEPIQVEIARNMLPIIRQ